MENQLANIQNIKNFILKSKINKILIISGQNSFYKTGADKLFLEILKNNQIFLYLKKKNLPEYTELKKNNRNKREIYSRFNYRYWWRVCNGPCKNFKCI